MGEITKNPMIDLNGVSARLKELEEQTGCPIKQINGQRIFGPPHDWGDEKPPRGSEIFVGRLPRDMFEDNLYPIFSTYGRLYTMRLMLEFSGVNRGFAFVTYSNPEEAKVAVEKLNRFEIIPNHTILAFISIDNCRLFVANIPCTKTIKDILVLFRRIMRGLVSVILCPNSKKGRNNRGFAFLEFDCHKNALEARKRFWPYNLKLWNRKLFVDWAIPHHLKSQCKQLLLKGLNTKTTSEALANAIYARLNKVTLLGLKIRGAEAVITFKTRSNATEAYQKLRGLSIGGAPLSVLYKFPEEEPINNGEESDIPLTCCVQALSEPCNNKNPQNSLQLFKQPQNRPNWLPTYSPFQQTLYNYNNNSYYSTFQSKSWPPNYGITPQTLYYPSIPGTPYLYNQNQYACQQPWYSNIRVLQSHSSPSQFWYPSNHPNILALPSTRTNTANVSNKKLSTSTSEVNHFTVAKVAEEMQKSLKLYPNDQNLLANEEETDPEDENFSQNSSFA